MPENTTPCIKHVTDCDKTEVTYDQSPLIMETSNPEVLVTMLHGLGDTCDGWSDFAAHMQSERGPLREFGKKVMFMLPTAPIQGVTVNGGMSMPAWYNISGLGTAGLLSAAQMSEDSKGVLASAEYVAKQSLYVARKFNIRNTRRIFFCGFSQGGAIALAAGLLASYTCGGVVSMSGYLAARSAVLSEFKKPQVKTDDPCKCNLRSFPILQCHGAADEIVPIDAAKFTNTQLTSEFGISKEQITFKEYKYLEHSANEQEINDVAAWLKQTLAKDIYKN